MAKFIFSAFCDESGESTIEGQMRVCRENNITHMELRNFGKEKNINNLTVEEAKEMKMAIDKAGMKVSSIGSAYGKINIKEPFEPHFEAFKNTVEVAKILEAKYIRIFSFFFTEQDSHEEYRDEVIRRVKAMNDYAKKRGVICCHENEKAIYGDTAERMLDLMEAFGGELRAVFDSANFVQCGVDTVRAFDALEPYIEYMHIKDALYEDGKVVPAGTGDGHVKEILERLNRQDREIILTLEPHLQVFDGFENLENGQHDPIPDGVYSSHEESFKAASDAMHKLVQEVQVK